MLEGFLAKRLCMIRNLPHRLPAHLFRVSYY